ncbi:MAG: PDZ domain-containing protein [Gemmatimonadetes bacterium]|nr:PDZ domain-containing protein [Gemmatimonadota bacterium]
MSRIPILTLALLAAAAPATAQSEAPRTEARAEAILAPAPEAPRRITFGFVLDPTQPPRVAHVLPGSPVARAGIRDGDTLVRFAGQPATLERIQTVARSTAPGDTVEIVIRRNGVEETIRVVPDGDARIVVVDPDSIRARARLYVDKAREGMREWEVGPLPFQMDSLGGVFRFDTLDFEHNWPMPIVPGRSGDEHRVIVMPRFDVPEDLPGFPLGRSAMGLRLAELNEGLARYFPAAEEGLLVLDVVAASPAARAGVQSGDVIVEVDGHEVWNVESFHAAREEGEARLVVVRQGARREIVIPAD